MSHHFPVILVSGSTGQAYLVVAAIVVVAWPTKLVRASSPEKTLQEVHRLTHIVRLSPSVRSYRAKGQKMSGATSWLSHPDLGGIGLKEEEVELWISYSQLPSTVGALGAQLLVQDASRTCLVHDASRR